MMFNDLEIRVTKPEYRWGGILVECLSSSGTTTPEVWPRRFVGYVHQCHDCMSGSLVF
jgi:hypothetical protein